MSHGVTLCKLGKDKRRPQLWTISQEPIPSANVLVLNLVHSLTYIGVAFGLADYIRSSGDCPLGYTVRCTTFSLF